MPESNLPISDLQAWLLSTGRKLLTEPGGFSHQQLSSAQLVVLQQQLEWQKRSRPRFPEPELWLWSDRSLSQASDWLSACFKASLFPDGELVMDGCCGAGVDAVALAGRGPVVAVDSDPWMAALTESNAAAHNKNVLTFSERLSRKSLRGARWMHVDPDRRSNHRKTLNPEDFSPPLSEILSWSDDTDGTIVKIAPSTLFEGDELESLRDRCLRIWIGSRGECRQQLLVCGQALVERLLQRFPEAETSVIRPGLELAMAILLDASGTCLSNSIEYYHSGRPAEIEMAPVEEVDRYVFDLHATLFASNLHSGWANNQGMSPITSEYGFYTGSQPVRSPFARAFEVLEILPWDDRKVRQWLRQNCVGEVEVKCRLTKLNASEFQRRLQRSDGQSVSLLITRIGPRTRCIVCRPVA